MGFEWTTLGKFIKVHGGYAYRSKDFISSGNNRVLKIKNIRFGSVDYDDTVFIRDELASATCQYKTKPKDVLISMTGSGPNAPNSLVGRVARIWEDEPEAWINQRVGRLELIEEKSISLDFVYYLLTEKKAQDFLVSNSSGSANQANISGKTIESLPCPNVSFSESKNISQILLSFDNKIQLNNQINQTLEAMAQAIFKSWFVDFDPVRAKHKVLDSRGSVEDAERAAMRIISSKTDEQLDEMLKSQSDEFAKLQLKASLFPSKLVDSELGEIPAGWKVSTIENICWLNQNSISKKDAPEKVKYVDLGNTKWGEIQATSIYDFKNAPSRARRILKRNDTIIGTVRPRNGSYAYIYDDGLTGSTGFAVLTPKDIIFSEFLYFCATNEKNIERLGNLADGGAYPAVNSQLILNTPCVMPNCELEKNNVTNSYHKITSFIMSKVYENYTQNQTLAELRDTLLPKLLSGELDVSGLAEMQDD